MSKLTNDEFVGRLCALKADEDYIPATNILLEVTEVDGVNVEVAFNMPEKGNLRIYVQIPLAELVSRVALFHQDDK